MLNWVIETSLKHRFAVLLLTAAAALFGVYALTRLDIDAFPDTTPVQVQINTVATAMNPEEIETQITAPLEQVLGGLPRLHAIRSTSKFGLSQVVVLFDDDTDIHFARQVVAERLASVALPAGIPRPKLGPISSGLGEVFHYVVRLKDRDLSSLSDADRTEKLTYLRTVHDWTIRPKLRTVPGVAEVNSWGGCEKQYQVRPDPDRLLRHGVAFNELLDALERANRNTSGGGVQQNNQFVLVQGIGRTTTLDELKAIIVTNRNQVPVRVRDVADVEVGHEVRRGSMTAMGQGEAVLGLCFLTMGENSKTVSTALRQRLDEIRSSIPADIEVVIVYDRTELVDTVIETVRRNLFEGGILVIAVLFAFLGNLRAAAIVALVIPLSMLFAFTGMWKFGIAASLLSLGALDFGMVVDSSVVMVENCVRHIAHGDLGTRTKTDVVREAAVEVRKPTLFGELIIMIVYLPILTLEGTEGKMFRPMAMTVIFALLGSMVLSMTLMPVLASLVLPRKIRETPPLPMRVALLVYKPILAFSMTFKLPVLIFAAGLVAVALGMIAPHLGSEFIPKLSEGAIALNVVRLAGTDLSESNNMNTVMERLILENFPDEVRHVWSRVGSAEVATDPMGIELTDMYVTLKPRAQWTKAATQDELTDKLRTVLRRIPGQKIAFEQPIEMRISEMETGIRTDVGVRLYGDDYSVLTKEAARIEAALKTVPGAVDVSSEQVTGQPVLQIRLRSDELARYGVPTQTVLNVIEAVGAKPVGEIVDGPLRFALAVRLPDAWRKNPEALGAVTVTAPNGERVPLARLTTVDRILGPSTITREGGQRRIAITCNVKDRDVGTFVTEARTAVKPVQDALPKGRYWLDFSGEFEKYERAKLRLFIVIPAALAMIVTLLWFTYHNITDVLRVLTGTLFGCVGGLFALWWRDLPLSISALVGFIALAGVAVLDDMILVSTVRQYRRQGMSVTDAVRQASLVRLRPVLMTTLVASLGFLPMALSTGQGAEVQRPLATVVIGGVVGAMVMSLLVLRVLYLVFDQIARAMVWLSVRVLRLDAVATRSLFGVETDSPLTEDM